ncbi:MAG: HDOD domain-containing protein, partial [Syntrophobacteraceae bacterium]
MASIPLDENEIRYQIAQIEELPALPQAIKRLIEIIHSEIDTPGELESIIGYDPSLAAKVVMVGNTSYYGYRGRVKTLSKAISIIGANQVKSICIFTLLMNLLSNGRVISPAHREMLWKHSFATSKIAAEITKKRPWMNEDEAAVLGLIHDLGWIVMAMYFNEQFVAIFESAARKNIPPWCVEMQYGLSHTLLGKYLATRWVFPESFKAVMEFHHSPEMSQSFKTEVRLMHLVNVLSHSHEYPELVNDEFTLSHCRELYICEDEWQEIQESVQNTWSEVD